MDATHTIGTPLDYGIIIAYFVLILGFGSVFGRFTKSTKDFFFGGQRFSWWLVSFSMVATTVGSYSFIKYSHVAFEHGLASTMSYTNDWFWMPIFMFIWLPVVYFSKVTSVPEYFERMAKALADETALPFRYRALGPISQTRLRQLPEVGQAVQVRGRLGTVRTVAAYDTGKPTGRLHLVEVEYLDERGQPEEDQLLWEVEPTGRILGDTSLPRVDEYRPDSPGALRAFLNTHRWTRLNRLREAGNVEEEPLLSVWNSAIQINPYQLEPVLRALEMPRVSLLLCDGVGLGKTIQAGLVLQELLLRRRIRRVLIVCPAMLQRQWRYELQRKFNLDFEIIDSESTFQLRRRLGIDTNPWKVSPRIITSIS